MTEPPRSAEAGGVDAGGSASDRRLLVCAVLHSSGLGGAEQSHVEHAQDLLEQGVVVHSVLPAPDLGLGRILRDAGLPVTMARPAPWWIGVEKRPPSDAARQQLEQFVSAGAVRDTTRILAQVRPRAVVSVTSVIPHGALAARTLGIPHIWLLSELAVPIHGLYPTVPHEEIGRAIEGLSDAVVCVSRAVRTQFFGERSEEDFAARGIEVIHLAPRMPIEPVVDRAADELTVGPGPLKIGVVGTFCPGKGQSVALEALSQLVRRGRDVHLTLFGAGSSDAVEGLRTQADVEGVAGLLELRFERDRRSIYSSVDVVVVASVQEGFGRVPFEAAAARRPVVYADEGALTEFMIPGRTGLPFRPGESQSLAQALERLIDEPDVGVQLAAEAAELLEAFSSTPSRGLQHRAVIERVLNRHFARPWHDLIEAMRADAISAPLGGPDVWDEEREDLLALRGDYERTQRALEKTLARWPVRIALFVSNVLRSPRSLGAQFALLRRRWAEESNPGLRGPLDDSAYADWRDGQARSIAHQALTPGTPSAEPFFSLVMPVCDPPVSVLQEAIGSIRAQLFKDWELVIVDDASTDGEVLSALRAAGEDARITVVRKDRRSGISDATNRGVAPSRGRWVGFVDHDDVLDPHVLQRCAEAALSAPDARMVFTDEDKLVDDGRLIHPRFKAGFDRVRVLHENYVNHLTLFHRALLDRVGPLRPSLDGSQDWDLVIRASRLLADDQIVHVEHIGYHWRQAPRQFSQSNRGVAQHAGASAVSEHLAEQGVPLVAAPHPNIAGGVALAPRSAAAPDVTALVLVRNATEAGLQRTVQNARWWLRDGVGSVILASESEGLTERVRRLLRAHEMVADAVTISGESLSERLRDALPSVQTAVTLVVDESLRPAHGSVAATLAGYLGLDGVGLVAPRTIGVWGLVEHGPIMMSGDGLIVTGREVEAEAVGYFGEFAIPQQVAGLEALCFAAPTDMLRAGDIDLGRADSGGELAMIVALNIWRSSQASAWVPTISVRRRRRDGDGDFRLGEEARRRLESEFAIVDRETRRLPRLPSALRVHRGELVLDQGARAI